ncbi:deoxyribose-phosphate aldolase [Legionella waltersii]|uniref:Deoxyribose-phosphate aldolase n=1 Tax=Legionella waltersii TaxID=66969 RepID=A0A0W1ALQ4_9GAMM|nr:deoxyribose-phosphate aldolase [Legionella waltersii]KTD82263.1 2-deoxyribose-5-phosphate aldolase [Legionella waltersii]SNV04409.1 deoxyribose-phosphate aldolase [Legionella waltersii]
MSLDSSLNTLLNRLLSQQQRSLKSNLELIQCIDLTLLDEAADKHSLGQVYQQAQRYPVAAICVYSQHLNQFVSLPTIKLATVVNFPQGTDELLSCLAAIDQAVNIGAHEIDYVFPYEEYMSGNKQKALNHCDVIIQDCKKLGLNLKIILETGAFPNMDSVYQLSSELISLGAPFLKTSTGKINTGATFSAAFAILTAIKDAPEYHCGIKLSGGIKSTEQAQQYAHLAELLMEKAIHPSWFRIGASSLLTSLTVP